MKIRKMLAALSAITMTITASAGYFPAKQIINARAEDSIQSEALELPTVNVMSSAEKTTSDGFKYKSDGTNVTITGYTGSKKSIVIPDEIDGMAVTVISERAFYGNTALTSVDISESVTTIEQSAFENCTNLSTIKLHEGIQNIDGYAFRKTAVKEIYIPLSLTNVSYKLGNGIFAGCEQLETVKFAKGINRILNSLFRECTGLKSINIPEDVTEIGEGAFCGCNALESISLSDTLKDIEKGAFQGCTSLLSIDIPKSVTTIGQDAFYFCTNLSTIKLHEGIQNIDGYAFRKTAVKEIYIPSSLTKISYKLANGIFENCEKLIHATLADGIVNVPDRLFLDAPNLTTVNVPTSVESFGDYTFQNCTNLKYINAEQDFIDFKPNTFAGCTNFTDNRFTLFDTEKTGIFSNANVSSVNGTVNYTIQYKFKDNVANEITDLKLKLVIPDGMTIISDSFTSTDSKADFEKVTDGVISLSETEGSLNFTARVVENGKYSIGASAEFSYNKSSWKHNIGSINVAVPDIMINTADTTNKLSADIYGIAAKGAEVEIFVNDKSAGKVISNAKTGKYSTTVKLPKDVSGTVYSLYAKAGDTVSDEITTVYQSEKPTVQNVVMHYNEDKQIDITNVLTEGVSPIISYNPAKPLKFEIKVTNTDRIDRLFVTSEKGNEMKYIEANYDSKKKLWIADGFFDDNNHHYVPGGLNVSIIEKALDHVDEDNFNAEEYDTIDLPEEVKENSTFEVVEETENSMLANITVSNGTTSANYQHYTEIADGIYIDGKYRTAAEVAKNPEKYGYKKVDFQSQSGEDVYSYYIKIVDPADIHEDTVLKLKNAAGDALEFLSGTSILKKLEGESADDMLMKDQVSFANNYVAGQFIDMLKYQSEELLGADIYSGITKNLSFIKTTAGLFYDMEQVQDNPELQAAIVSMYLIKMFRSIGGEKALFSLCGATPPVSTVLGFLISAGLDKMNEYINECIAGNHAFSFSGFLKFIIDPSGVVYEAVLSNPIEGATVTVYYQDPETGEAVVWDAENYDQYNPLVTESDGKYLWDVPEGLWKVVCEKEGYETSETDWMTIPPVRTDVNISIVSKAAPKLISADMTNSGITVKFSKYIDVSTVKASTLVVDGFTGKYTVSPIYANEGDKYADTFIIKGDFAGEIKSVTATNKILSYAGTAEKKLTVTVTDSRGLIGDANCDDQVNMADAVYIMQCISNPDKYQLTETGRTNADTDGSGDITNKDALMIQQFKLGLIKEFSAK